MSLTVQSLNGDTAFLLTFAPPIAPATSPALFPGAFTILIDPWLKGPATILSTIFSTSEQKTKPCISCLTELEQEPDIILISQDKPDHCHEETLRQLPKDCQSTILATPAAARKIRSWKHFPPQLVQSLPRYIKDEPGSIYRLVLPPHSPRGTCGEVTITWIPARRDITNLHHAIGITYRPPGSVLSIEPGRYLDIPLPKSPPVSPHTASPLSPSSSSNTNPWSPRTPSSPLLSPNSTTLVPSPITDQPRSKTLSVIYSPHGVPYSALHPYASTHLVRESALPLTALLHSFDTVSNPWYLGGNVSAGSPGGTQIARSLYARAWIGAHDADKLNRGVGVRKVRIEQFDAKDVRKMVVGEMERASRLHTKVVDLGVGEVYRIEGT
ncbi:hypothetical protein M011DRAFT_463719 [Sporormia fimetaria CBS 119925]|uniref:Metallo-beta-lactamase domain-containing protein n=1 Tax=Sporormia fimetaria CBS 119925 TaxID=1340428 RepID=A0A6A6VSJ8_9PLEO|nr:hypothetical protein M011DRAFT_463719 [Sporormia fimetaria CBS 119925]